MFKQRNLTRRGILGSGLAAGTLASCTQAPESRLSDLRFSSPPSQTDLEALRKAADLPAIGLMASQTYPSPSGTSELILVAGERQLGAHVPVTAQDRWHLGSLTKAFTATLVARCVEAGVLTWSTTIGDVLGGRLDGIRSEYRPVTVLHLLSHRSGIPAHETDWSALGYPREEADARASRSAFSQDILREKPSARAGEGFIYTNRGYVVLGAMLERLLGAPWEKQLSAHVLGPLNMLASGFGAPGTPGRMDQPVGHASWFTQSRTPHPPGSDISDNPAVLGPAGRLHASLPDVMSFLIAHRDRSSFLKTETWAALHTPPFGGEYALGWFVAPDRMWHDGTNTLFNARMSISADARSCGIAVCNDGDYTRSQPAMQRALEAALPQR